jgi:hypothetical protein
MPQATTTAIHDARWRDTVVILAQMSDASAALARLREMSVDLRGAAIVGADGEVLAATGDPDAWRGAARDLFAAADAAGGDPALPAQRVHVATEDGEAFGLRSGSHAVVAVAERFTLASLMLFDMRSALRDLAA